MRLASLSHTWQGGTTGPPQKRRNKAIHTKACLFAVCGEVEVSGEEREERENSGPLRSRNVPARGRENERQGLGK